MVSSLATLQLYGARPINRNASSIIGCHSISIKRKRRSKQSIYAPTAKKLLLGEAGRLSRFPSRDPEPQK